ncbi:MAG: HupE/UreJ family protein [Pseudomonadales bacterium]|nr:HupE/UreJ family protein [Pseudomonadales bacterium]MBO6656904.1 HupE/UreJ family protein [Pseudomonadales bacterium]
MLLRYAHIVVLIITLSVTSGATGHMLNMTHIDVKIDSSAQGSLTLNIDLGQSLISPEAYWDAANQLNSEAHPQIRYALAKLEQALQVTVGESPIFLERHSVSLQADSLSAVTNPLIPQMTTIRYDFQVQKPSPNVRVSLNPTLTVPWPCLVRLDLAGQPLPMSRVITDETRVADFAPDQGTLGPVDQLVSKWAGLAPQAIWVAIGFQHILPLGLDHMLFVLGLFFLAGGWRVLLLQVTCFTIAHSVTLALSTLKWIAVPTNIVEPLIALSIVYIALDNLYSTHLARWRLAVITVFGLLHGMGFAAVLSDIGLPKEGFINALALFNIGVELGQLTVLLLAFMLVGWWRKQGWYQTSIAQPATVAIAGTGLYWFIKRAAF